MGNVTEILMGVQAGDSHAADQLLPLVYNELRRMAAQKLADEKPGQTLQATALVHEAYLRLVGPATDRRWESHSQFFAAAAETMRWILVDNARRKLTAKHGGDRRRIELDHTLLADEEHSFELLELNDLLDRLAEANPQAVELVKLRFFAGLTGDQAAAVLGVSPRSVDMLWAYARAWLFEKIKHQKE